MGAATVGIMVKATGVTHVAVMDTDTNKLMRQVGGMNSSPSQAAVTVQEPGGSIHSVYFECSPSNTPS
jgi:hypothetical protein